MRPHLARMKKWMALAGLAVLAACGPEEEVAKEPGFYNMFAADTLAYRADYKEVPQLSAEPISLEEASGGVAAHGAEGCFWTFNDSGNLPELYLIHGASGQVVHQLVLDGLNNTDWESMDCYRASDSTYKLVIADIGDNRERRKWVTAYQFDEPNVAALDTVEGPQVYTPQGLDSVSFTYSTGPRDVEAFFVDPLTSDWYLISKRESAAGVYKLTAPFTQFQDTARLVGRFTLTLATAADSKALPNLGSPIVVKNYDHLLYWPREAGTTVEEALQATPQRLHYDPREPQGEALWLWPNGDIGTCSELKGEEPKIRRYERK